MAEQFVMGRTIEEALERSREDAHARYRHSYDMLGEAALTAAMPSATSTPTRRRSTPSRRTRTSASRAPRFARPGISIKLSALHPRYEFAQRERVLAELAPASRRSPSARATAASA